MTARGDWIGIWHPKLCFGLSGTGFSNRGLQVRQRRKSRARGSRSAMQCDH